MSDVQIGYVQVLCRGVTDDAPFAVAWMDAWQKVDGRRYARMPKKPFYRRGRGGVKFKVLSSTFIPNRRLRLRSFRTGPLTS